MKLLFLPFSILSGLVAGFIGKKAFNKAWALFDEEQPPDAKQLNTSWPKLILAAAVQGAIFKAVSEATDHASRRAFMNATGRWPGSTDA